MLLEEEYLIFLIIGDNKVIM
jgi:hypothetical protein